MISCKILYRHGMGAEKLAQDNVELEFIPSKGSIVEILTDENRFLRGVVVSVVHAIARGDAFEQYKWNQQCVITIDVPT